MTNEHDSAWTAATSLRGKGEVCRERSAATVSSTDAQMVPVEVFGDGRSGKGDTLGLGDLSCQDAGNGAGRSQSRKS
ncbi:MAG: hypothetical protein R3F19_10415 [Verrucomicrobiales bacterium]